MVGSESGRKTTIWVSVELKEELRKIGRMGDTYEDVIWRLLENVVRWPGFEPGLAAWQAAVLDQTRLPPHRPPLVIELGVIYKLFALFPRIDL